MDIIKKPQKSKIAILLGIYILLLVLNLFTTMLVDDYTYSFSFTDGEKIESVLDLPSSIIAHGRKMNGRYFAHFLAQLFLILPQIIFKIINPAVFCLLIYIIARMASKAVPAHLMLLAFSLIFVFEPAFGQVNLWLDGACNYLFSYAVCLLWLMTFFIYYREEVHRPVYKKTAIVILGFLAGGWNENASAATIFMAVSVIALLLYEHRHVGLELKLSAIGAILGFIIMAFAPAETANKIAGMDFGILRENIVAATKMLGKMWLLIMIYALLLTISVMTSKISKRNRIAMILGMGALVSNYIMVFATYYHDRSAGYTAVLFAAGCVILARELFSEKRELVIALIVLSVVSASYFVIIGTNDVYLTYRDAKANEAHLISCREAGESSAEIPTIHAETKYSPANGLKYIDTADPSSWPNYSMAKYYGLGEIKGK